MPLLTAIEAYELTLKSRKPQNSLPKIVEAIKDAASLGYYSLTIDSHMELYEIMNDTIKQKLETHLDYTVLKIPNERTKTYDYEIHWSR